MGAHPDRARGLTAAAPARAEANGHGPDRA